VLGVGIGCSKQKFYYLPQQYTDFIFAVLCEETGWLGAVFVLSLFFVFAARGLRLARRAENRYQSLLVCGVVAWITCQALVNVFVVLGLLPATGIPLPFVSYGGSSLLFSMFAVGLVLNISANLNQEVGRRA
jgi:cell division protein FtsW